MPVDKSTSESRGIAQSQTAGALGESRRRAIVYAVCAGLVFLTVAVFWQTRAFRFVNFDDTEYVTRNPHVLSGLTWEGIRWAFMHPHFGNWIPLTLMSHMLDCELYGLDAAGHHSTNLQLHLLNTLLLFLFLSQATGSVWRSAFVAAVFAVHPLHVEPVAWVSSRKDLLSTLFWMLALLAYVAYAKRGGAGRYGLVLLCFVLGLLSKAMVVTLPFVLLLLDYWPLGRLGAPEEPAGAGRSLWRLSLEKVPFFILSGAAVAITFWTQQVSRFIVSSAMSPLSQRLANVAVTYAAVLRRTLWPVGLSPFYPNPGHAPPAWQVVGALALLGFISAAVYALRRRRALTVGWLWYIGAFAPAVGFVRIGSFITADRYTYIPLIGLAIMAAWAVPDLEPRPARRKALALLGAAIILTATICALAQARVWRDGRALFARAVAVTENNYVAEDGLAVALYEEGQYKEALAHHEEALQIAPGYARGWFNCGNTQLALGDLEKAAASFAKAAQLDPSLADASNNLGNVLCDLGRHEQAADAYRVALRADPRHALAHANLGQLLAERGEAVQAEEHFALSLAADPRQPLTHYLLARVLEQQGDLDGAALHFGAALELDPHFTQAAEGLTRARGPGVGQDESPLAPGPVSSVR